MDYCDPSGYVNSYRIGKKLCIFKCFVRYLNFNIPLIDLKTNIKLFYEWSKKGFNTWVLPH